MGDYNEILERVAKGHTEWHRAYSPPSSVPVSFVVHTVREMKRSSHIYLSGCYVRIRLQFDIQRHLGNNLISSASFANMDTVQSSTGKYPSTGA